MEMENISTMLPFNVILIYLLRRNYHEDLITIESGINKYDAPIRL